MKNSGGQYVRTALEKALLDLMAQKPLTDITVSELVREAGVARVSFYRHFSSITDVLDSISEDLTSLFSGEIVPPIHSNDEKKWREFLSLFFYQTAQNPQIIRAARFTDNDALMKRFGQQLFPVLEQQERPTMWEVYSWVGKLNLLTGISETWLNSGMRETPEEMIDYVMSIIRTF